jgi:hypothetical protein
LLHWYCSTEYYISGSPLISSKRPHTQSISHFFTKLLDIDASDDASWAETKTIDGQDSTYIL